MTAAAMIKIIGAMLLWAACFPLITAGLEFSPHLTFATLRAVLAGAALTIVAILLGRSFPRDRRLWSVITVVGICATGIGYFGMFHASEFVSPGLATVIANTQPILAAVLASLWLSEKLRGIAWVGLAAGFAGIVLIASPQLAGDAGMDYGIGVAYIILAAIGISVSNVAIKSITQEVDALAAMGLQMLVGSVPLAVMAAALENPLAVNWTPTFVGSLLALAFLGSALVYWLWFSALETVALSRANVYSFLVPGFGLAMGAIFYDETYSWPQISGIGLILIGIVIVNLTSDRDRTAGR